MYTRIARPQTWRASRERYHIRSMSRQCRTNVVVVVVLDRCRCRTMRVVVMGAWRYLVQLQYYDWIVRRLHRPRYVVLVIWDWQYNRNPQRLPRSASEPKRIESPKRVSTKPESKIRMATTIAMLLLLMTWLITDTTQVECQPASANLFLSSRTKLVCCRLMMEWWDDGMMGWDGSCFMFRPYSSLFVVTFCRTDRRTDFCLVFFAPKRLVWMS